MLPDFLGRSLLPPSVRSITDRAVFAEDRVPEKLRRSPCILAVLLLISALTAGAPASRAQDPEPPAGSPASAPLQRAVTAIGVARGDAGAEVTISGDGELAYEYFLIEGRSLVVDIPGAASRVWPADQPVDDEQVSRVQVAEQGGAKPGVRVVIDLKRPDGFTVRGDGSRIVVAFSHAAAPAPAPVAAPASPAADRDRSNRVADVVGTRLPGVFRVAVKTDIQPVYRVLDSPDQRKVTVAVDGARLDPAVRPVTDYTGPNAVVTRFSAAETAAARPSVLITLELREPAPFRVFADASGVNIDVTTDIPRPADARPSARPAPSPAPTAQPQPAVAAAPGPAQPYAGTLISLDFQDADIGDVFRLIAEVSGSNIVYGDDVKGKRTITMREVPWDQALDVLLRTNLPPLAQFRESPNIIRITPLSRVQDETIKARTQEMELQRLKTDLQAKEALAEIEIQAKKALAEREALKADTRRDILSSGLIDRTFVISYASLDKVMASINKLFEQYDEYLSAIEGIPDRVTLEREQTATAPATQGASAGRSQSTTTLELNQGVGISQKSCPNCLVEFDPRTSTIFIRAYSYYLEQCEMIIKALDRPTPLVMVEARIVEVNNDYERNLGIQWGASLNADAAHGNALPYAFPNSVNIAGTQESGNGNYLVNLPVATSTAGIGISLGHVANTLSLDLNLSALEQLGKTKVLSTPKLLVLQNETASIQIGDELPITTRDVTETSSTTQVEWKKVGIILEVTPNVTHDGRVRLDLNIEKSSRGEDVNTTEGVNFSVVQNKASTKVLIDDGSTAVIGGLFTQSTSETEDSVPGLSKLPLVGWLFKSKGNLNDKKELLIFITPRIIHDARD